MTDYRRNRVPGGTYFFTVNLLDRQSDLLCRYIQDLRAAVRHALARDSRAAKGERGIWQRRFWEHTIRDDRDYATHVDYIHFNPAKHGLVAEVQDWPYSSFHRHVGKGLYPAFWSGNRVDIPEAGERS